MAVPMISVLRGFIMGGGVSSIVQLGHWMGYSTLLLGFTLRRMKLRKALFSIDIDKPATDFTRSWIERARLDEQVALHLGDSADPSSADAAVKYLGRAPQVVIIDSSHQYTHTLRELDLWYERLAPGGMLFMHDVSEYAAGFDGTGKGGVRRAAREWIAKLPAGQALLIDGNPDVTGESGVAYADGCGLGIIQKPAPARKAGRR
jgi:predicted O-methyltransferase YrrM